MSIAVIYCSGAGHTRRLAEHVVDGVAGQGGAATLIDVEMMGDDDWVTLDAADAIIFGAPTYMGSAAAPFKAFMDETSDRWSEQVWADKIAGGFTVGNCFSGDKMMVHLQFVVLAAQHGMIWVGQTEMDEKGVDSALAINVEGANVGVGATSSEDKSQLINPGDAETARRYGARIARVTARWARGL